MEREGGVLRLRGGKVGGVKAKDLWDKVGAAPDTTRAAATAPKPPCLPPAILVLSFLDGACRLRGVAPREMWNLAFTLRVTAQTGCKRTPADKVAVLTPPLLQTMGDLNGMEEELRTELMSLRVAQQVGTRQPKPSPSPLLNLPLPHHRRHHLSQDSRPRFRTNGAVRRHRESSRVFTCRGTLEREIFC